MEIRKTVAILEDTLKPGAAASQPEWRVAVVAVVQNPLVATNTENLNELVNEGADIGRFLADRALQFATRQNIAAVGKAAIVGLDGEPEHAQSILHPKFANAVRSILDLPGARMIGDKKIAQAGTPIKVTLLPIDAQLPEQVAGEMELRIPGSPRDDEILVALVLAGVGARA
jgi:hypothetical protein